MREIKFRGTSMGGHYVYGLLTKKKIRNSGKLAWAIATGNFSLGETIPVTEDSIAQLIATDINGREVYENDKVTSTMLACENWHRASFNDYDGILKGGIVKCEQ